MSDRKLQPILPTPMPRDPPDGTTAWSDEAGLPGEPRLLAWTVVQDDGATFDIHVLWDTPELDEAMDAALSHAQAFFGPNMSGGVVIATLNSADNAIEKRFGPRGWLADRGSAPTDPPAGQPDTPPATSLEPPMAVTDTETTHMATESYGEERRSVSVSRTAEGGVHFDVTDYGPMAASLTGGRDYELHYVVPPSKLPRFIELADVDVNDLIPSIVERWSHRSGELFRILEDELGIPKFIV